MFSQLLNLIEESKSGLCIQIEYYHVVGCVIKIWKSPRLIGKEKPLIEVQSDMETAPMKALLMLKKYLDLTEQEQENISAISLQIKALYGVI